MGNGGRNRNKNAEWGRNEDRRKIHDPKPMMEFRPIHRKKIIDDLQEKSQPKVDSVTKERPHVDIQNAESKSPWKVNKEVVEDIRRSANKFAILEEILESEDLETQKQNEIEIVNLWEKTWNSECLDEKDVYDNEEGITEGFVGNELIGNDTNQQ
ncbi:hypothetical protein Tco_0211463 [Tanacetum coccineum]